MGRLSNGRTLMDSPVFRGWLLVAASTTSSVVISEGTGVAQHAVRERLARQVLVAPEVVLDRLTTLVGTDVSMTANPPVFDDAMETAVQAKVNEKWTELSTLMDTGAA